MGRALLLALLSSEAHAQAVGPQYSVNVRGVQMHCTSFAGEPVAIFLDPSLNNVGIANRVGYGPPYIVINPNVTARYSDLVTQWWFAHECSHHALPRAMNSESNADCFAIRQLRMLGLLRSPDQLRSFYAELSNLPGSRMGHLPGPARVRHIARCAGR